MLVVFSKSAIRIYQKIFRYCNQYHISSVIYSLVCVSLLKEQLIEMRLSAKTVFIKSHSY